jgi:hypothetical protein
VSFRPYESYFRAHPTPFPSCPGVVSFKPYKLYL